ncbi:MAG: gamma-glutamyltransferase, partial [Armatimonadota bacterium]
MDRWTEAPVMPMSRSVPTGSAPTVGGPKATLASAGMVSSSHPRASEAGVAALQAGGNAADAALAAAAMMNMVKPASCGVGGDAFVILYMSETNELRALNANGRPDSHVAEGRSVAAFSSACCPSPDTRRTSWFQPAPITHAPNTPRLIEYRRLAACPPAAPPRPSATRVRPHEIRPSPPPSPRSSPGSPPGRPTAVRR